VQLHIKLQVRRPGGPGQDIAENAGGVLVAQSHRKQQLVQPRLPAKKQKTYSNSEYDKIPTTRFSALISYAERRKCLAPEDFIQFLVQ